MKHAGAQARAKLEGLISALRAVDGLIEKSPGVFYYRSRSFLHFHEDPAGLFADVRFDGTEFERRRVTTVKEQQQLRAEVTAWIKARTTTLQGHRR